MNTSEEYCIACGQDGPLRREQKATEFDVRGETLRITVPMKVCPACGTTELEDVDPAEIAFAEYRRRKGLLSPGQIRETRERYQLSQKSFAALLGMSEATINRYEGGGIQDEAHDQAIRACGNPDVVADLLKRRSHKLSDWQRLRVEAALGHTGEPRQWGRVSFGSIWRVVRPFTDRDGGLFLGGLRDVCCTMICSSCSWLPAFIFRAWPKARRMNGSRSSRRSTRCFRTAR